MPNGYRLREARCTRGYTQEQVADYLGITRNAYNMYERGKREISLESLVAVANWYGCTTDELLGTNAWEKTTNNDNAVSTSAQVTPPSPEAPIQKASDIHLKIRRMRKHAGMSQEELARRLGVSARTIDSWERDETAPDAAQIWDCAVLLGCTPNDLMGWKSPDESMEELSMVYDSMDPRGKDDLLRIARALFHPLHSCESDKTGSTGR